MMTAKEIFLELLKPDGQPDQLLRQYEAPVSYTHLTLPTTSIV